MLNKKSSLAFPDFEIKNIYKLDQETWLCRTHLNYFLVKILTILDHTRTRLNLVIKAILLNLWYIFLDHLGPVRTIQDHSRPYWAFWDHFWHFGNILDILGTTFVTFMFLFHFFPPHIFHFFSWLFSLISFFHFFTLSLIFFLFSLLTFFPFFTFQIFLSLSYIFFFTFF